MAEQKPPYTLKIKIASARADAISDALAAIHELASDAGQSGDHTTTVTIAGFTEQPLLDIRAAFESFLWHHAVGMECKIGLEGPGIRPEMTEALRATPMDREWQDFANRTGASVKGSLLGQQIDVRPRTA